MRIRKFKKALTESNEIDVMAMMRRAMALYENAEDGTEGLDEFDDEEMDDDMDMDMDDMDDDMMDDSDIEDDMVTITVPREVAEELLTGTEEAISGEDIDDMSDEELISDDDIAEADDNIEADNAAEEMLSDEEGGDLEEEDEEDDFMEEDEEGFAVETSGNSPKRTRFTGSYRNEPTVPSIIKGAISSYGTPVTVADGSPKRSRFTGSYRNEPSVKSKYQFGTRAHQNT